MKPTRVGIIGCGVIATSGHAPAYQTAAKKDLCEIVGVCDPILSKAKNLGSIVNAPHFQSPEALFEAVGPEAVSIATLPNEHKRLSLLAFDAGAHVLCEKPIAMNFGEAADIVDAAKDAKRKFSICFQYRTWQESQHIKTLIDNGTLGHVHSIRTWGGETYGFKAVPARYNWQTASGGVIAHWTIHNIDLALWLLGFPTAVSVNSFHHQRIKKNPDALGGNANLIDVTNVEDRIEDYAASMIRLENDAVLTVESNRLQPPYDRPEGWELLGSKGSASISPIKVWIDGQGQWKDATPSNLDSCNYDMSLLIHEFLMCVRSNTSPSVKPNQILQLQRIVDALYTSGHTGKEVVI